MKKTGYVTADHEHFKKSKLEYKNWIQALFREAIQNAIDAKADTINIVYSYDQENKLNIEFSDNGKGMSLDTLLNVLLKMGGSKKDDNSIGGFGYAKSILFFAHNNYYIKTRDNEVHGVGGEYTYNKTKDFFDGTSFKVNIDRDYYLTELNKIKLYLEEILIFSDLKNIDFIINGEKNNFTSKVFSYDLNTSLGKVSFNDHGFGNFSKLWIRVNGLAMFEHSLYQKETNSIFEGVIELNEPPLKVLTANRDSLQYLQSRSLNGIFSELSKGRDKFTYEGIFNFILNKEDFESEETTVDYKEDVEVIHETVEKDNINIADDNVIDNLNSIKVDKIFKSLSKDQTKFEDFFKKSLSKINQQYYPKNFSIITEKKDNKDIGQYKCFFNLLLKKKNIKLSIMWSTIVDSILKTSFFKDYIKNINGVLYFNEYKILKGFVFSDETIASNSIEKDICNISINPTSQYVENDFETLLDIAIHECIHCLIPEHNSSFCFQEFKLKRVIQKEIKKSILKNEIKNKLKIN